MPVTKTHTDTWDNGDFSSYAKANLAFAELHGGHVWKATGNSNRPDPDPVTQQPALLRLSGEGGFLLSLPWVFRCRTKEGKDPVIQQTTHEIKQFTWCSTWNAKHFILHLLSRSRKVWTNQPRSTVKTQPSVTILCISHSGPLDWGTLRLLHAGGKGLLCLVVFSFFLGSRDFHTDWI